MFTLLWLACARNTLPESRGPGAETLDFGPESAGVLVLRGAEIVGLGLADLAIEDGRVVAVGEVEIPGAQELDLRGRFLAPAFIDAHVHLAYYPVAGELAAGGVAGAVDLAAPEATLAEAPGVLRMVRAGPMVTAVDGYPTTSWGRNGYGLSCANATEAVAAVDHLLDLGAQVIKLPVVDGASLDEAALSAAADRAHARGALVISHALYDDEAALAARIGADALAHTPVQALSEGTVRAWSGRTVISTLGAFGGSEDAVENLRRLHEAGATVLYGTDLGNTRTAAIDPREIRLLASAGLDGAAILRAGTADPASTFGFSTLGSLAVGMDASLLVLDEDPLQDPLALTQPTQVFIRGSAQRPGS